MDVMVCYFHVAVKYLAWSTYLKLSGNSEIVYTQDCLRNFLQCLALRTQPDLLAYVLRL